MKRIYKPGSKKRVEETKDYWEEYRKQIVSSTDEWKKYLMFSSKIFKHDFTTQVLTYGQNPNAKALADLDTWNRMGRRIHKGAKSVASFDISNKNMLMHIYDVTQVYGRDNRIPQIYSLKEKDTNRFLEIYNEKNKTEFTSIVDLVEFETELYYSGMTVDERYNLSDELKNAVKDSAKIAIFARNHEESVDSVSMDGIDKLFEYIGYDERKLVQVGDIVSNISGAVLRDMEFFIKIVEKENAIAATKESIKQKLEKQKEPPVILNNNINREEKKESNFEKEEIKKLKNEELEVQGQGNEEIEEEIHVHIPDKDVDDTFLENKEKEQINLFDFVAKSEEIQYIDIDTKVLLEGKTFKILDIDFENDLVKLEDDNAIMPIRRTDYGVDAFLANHNLQIDSKSKLIQISESMISENSIKSAAIRKCLLKGSGVVGGKGRIVEIFNKYKDEKDIVSAIKKEYGLGGGFGQTFLSAMYSPSKGIDISTDWDDKKYKFSLTWKQVTKEIKKLIDSNEYIRDYKKLELNNDFIIENLEKSPLFQNNKVELKTLASDRILLKEKLKELFLSQKSYFTDDFAWKSYEENGVDFFKRDKKELFTSKVINLDDLSNIVLDLLDEKQYSHDVQIQDFLNSYEDKSISRVESAVLSYYREEIELELENTLSSKEIVTDKIIEFEYKKLRNEKLKQINDLNHKPLDAKYELDLSNGPVVEVLWSEHPKFEDNAFYSFNEINEKIKELDSYIHKTREGLGALVSFDDERQPDLNEYYFGHYAKTKMKIHFEKDGELQSYEFRQDLGDGEGTILDHIKSYKKSNLIQFFKEEALSEHTKFIESMIQTLEGRELPEEEKSIQENYLRQEISKEETTVYENIAFQVEDKFLLIEESDEGYSYQLFDEDYNQMDGGEVDFEIDVSKEDKLVEIFELAELEFEKRVEIDYNDFIEQIDNDTLEIKEKVEYENIIKALCYEGGYHNKNLDDIVSFYKNNSDTKDRENFVKTLYKEKLFHEFSVSEEGRASKKERMSLVNWGEYLDIREGNFISAKRVSKLSWKEVGEYFKDIVEKAISKDISATIEEHKDEVQKLNYKTTPSVEDDKFSPKKVTSQNIEAIKTLKQIEKEERLATSKEQEILASYRGWGGVPQIFDENNKDFKNEFEVLKKLLSEEEYKSARASVNNAHYTDLNVIEAMHEAIESFGFKKGKILEPSMGVGNFFSVMPENFQNSRLYGVELDDISGRISKQLYQKAQINICGFEETKFNDNFFDIAIGNVPFGDYKVFDKAYSKYSLNIHDYFFIKSIDKLKIGGVLAFITSKGTLDKLNPNVRKMMAEKADFLGAVRLPNTAFKDVAGTDVTSDIIFLQKRDELSIEEPSWVNTALDKNNLEVNSYFVENPEMILGEMVIDERRRGMFGDSSKVTTCINKDPNFNLKESLKKALGNIKAEIRTIDNEIEEDLNIDLQEVVLNNDFENYSFQKVKDRLYFFQDGNLEKYEVQGNKKARILGMIELRDSLSELINSQVNHCSDEELQQLQADLSSKYDAFVKKYGNINDKGNKIFKEDDKYNLLCTLEKTTESGIEKADIFRKRTIFPNEIPDKVENAQEALIISINERGKVDLSYMQTLYKKDLKEIITELGDSIYFNPQKYNPNMNGYEFENAFELAEEYLSGDIKDKIKMLGFYLAEAEKNKEDNIEVALNSELINYYQKNINDLEAVMPEKLQAQEIEVRLGSSWIENIDYEKFAYETFKTSSWHQRAAYQWRDKDNAIKIEYFEKEDKWKISNKSLEKNNLTAIQSFGTSRKNAYEILEDILNLKSVTVKDAVRDEHGNKKYVVNKKETMLAREKQSLMKEQFKQWIWSDPERRSKYVDIYNDTFNTVRPRTFDGSHLKFNGINPAIKLRKHQKDGIARMIFGKNTLLAHVVGAGKSFTMISGIMEQKRLGIANKTMMVVPNHLTKQMGEEFLRLYPNAKILVTTNSDFQKENRKKFISKIATNNYDAVIIGHSKFEKIAVSVERQQRMIQDEMESLENLIDEMEKESGNRMTVKRLEKQKKSLAEKLKKLTDDSKKDTYLNFEQLGIDSLVVDEAHEYKNGIINSKMTNIAGLGSTPSQKATNMLMKCQYIQEKNNGRGVVFATGTPVSNSMAELFTMQKYLQYDQLKKMGMTHFDQWAANFGEVVSSLELAPEGTGYRFKNRFSKFFNLPELMNLFKEVADIKVAEDLNLPIPKLRDGKYKIITSPPTEVTKELMQDFAKRAESIRNGAVKPHEDNMLKVTNEARLLGTDPRLLDYEYSEEDLSIIESDIGSKLNQVVEHCLMEYKNSNEIKGTQIIFSDIGTPNSKKNFTVYDYIKESLIKRGIPENEICFIHDAGTDIAKEAMFKEMKNGSKRIIIGSTQKMGTGTNIQDRLIALHHVDCPYRPSDIEQREGRILRQGNKNDEVNIYRYVTKDSFDAYLWQLVENKQKFISQIMTSKTPLRNCEDLDETVLSFAEVKALATGNPLMREKMQLDNDIAELNILKAGYNANKYQNEDLICKLIPNDISKIKNQIEKLSLDIITRDKNKSEEFEMKLQNKIFTDKEFAGETLKSILKNLSADISETKIGEYKNFNVIADLSNYHITKEKNIIIRGATDHKIELGDSAIGNIQRIENALKSLESKIEFRNNKLEELNKNLSQAKEEIEKPFDKEQELQDKLKRQAELNTELEIGKEEDNTIEEELESDIEEVAAKAENELENIEDENSKVEIQTEENIQNIEVKKEGVRAAIENIKANTLNENNIEASMQVNPNTRSCHAEL